MKSESWFPGGDSAFNIPARSTAIPALAWIFTAVGPDEKKKDFPEHIDWHSERD